MEIRRDKGAVNQINQQQ